jgi:hypothetical protein
MSRIRAADVVKHRLRIASRRLGTCDPSETIAGLLDRSFDLPLGDPRYARNSLVPGSMPLEHSFSELAGNALRLDLEPLGPGASPASRQQEVSREMRRLVQASYGRPALRWFDERSEPWRGSGIHGNARFGAWFGAGFDDLGMQEAKVYYELDPRRLDDLPPNLRHAAHVAMSCLPGLVPIFCSIAAGRNQGAQRLYFYHRGDLRLLDLEPLMNRLGIGHQLPSLLTAIGLILGGRFTLPEGSVILALRDTQRGMEMKLETLMPAVPDPPQQIQGLIQMLLDQRPTARQQYRHWVQAMTPDELAGVANEGEAVPGELGVMSVRVNPTMGGRLTLYFRPAGYGLGERTRQRPLRQPQQADPYTQLA